jgi:hypothetical protein
MRQTTTSMRNGNLKMDAGKLFGRGILGLATEGTISSSTPMSSFWMNWSNAQKSLASSLAIAEVNDLSGGLGQLPQIRPLLSLARRVR